jgi:pimeloyl-ACP methyl ester carboxylesterase
MYLTVLGKPTYCYTGGKTFDASSAATKPTVVFIHGVLNDHSVWILQTRYLAHHGFNVLAVDLPGHGRSAGVNRDIAPCLSVEAAAEFIIALLDAAGIKTAALVGHSFGSLIALEAAARAPDRVTHLALLGTAFPMPVSPALLETSLNQPLQAIDMVNTFSHSMLAPPPSTLGPGTWLYGSSKALMRRIQASNTAFNLFFTGFTACNDYKSGLASVSIASAAMLFIVGKSDQMTPPKAAQTLINAATAAEKRVTVAAIAAGHQMMAEAPDDVLMALQAFLEPFKAVSA